MHLFHIQGKCNIRCKKNPLLPCHLKAEPHSDLHPDEASCSFGSLRLVRANPDSLQSVFDTSLEVNHNWGCFIVSLTGCEEVKERGDLRASSLVSGIKSLPVLASQLSLAGGPSTAVLGTWVGKGQPQQRCQSYLATE